jgi:hypothetical protein
MYRNKCVLPGLVYTHGFEFRPLRGLRNMTSYRDEDTYHSDIIFVGGWRGSQIYEAEFVYSKIYSFSVYNSLKF